VYQSEPFFRDEYLLSSGSAQENAGYLCGILSLREAEQEAVKLLKITLMLFSWGPGLLGKRARQVFVGER